MKIPIALSRKDQNGLSLLLKILFFLVATSWLLAPFLHGQYYGDLYLISNYEGTGQPWGWVFRTSDLLASLLLIILALRSRMWQKDRLAGGLIVAYAVLAALDAIFPLNCLAVDLNHCVSLNDAGTFAHYTESLITPLFAAALVVLDIKEHRRRISMTFLALQLLFGALVLANVITGQPAVFLEYIYEVSLVAWLLYFLENYQPRQKAPIVIGKLFRAVLALWVGLSGTLAIVIAAAHLHLYGRGFALYFGQSSSWLAQQGVFVGVLLLYLARQIYVGQRRAAYALLVIFGFEVFNYSLIDRQPLLAVLSGLTFIVLLVTRKSFARNVGPLNLHQRVYDLLALLVNVALALAVVAIILAALGRLGHAASLIDSGADLFTRAFNNHGSLVHDHSHHARQTVELLAFTTAAVGFWALFRPSRSLVKTSASEREKVKALLVKYASSSEDYFKLWPNDKSYFFASDKQGFIAYKLVKGTAFALPDPIASSAARREQLLKDFVAFCQSKGWTICLLALAESSKQLYENDFKLIPIGANAVVNIAEFNASTRRDKWWRWKINRGDKAGLSYESSAPPHSSKLLRELEQVSGAWLAHGGRREQGFALGYFDRNYLQQCRLHYVKKASSQIVAFTNELPVFKGSQASVDLLRYRPDDSDTMPYLLMSLIACLDEEAKFKTLDLGFVPLAQLDNLPVQLIKAAGKIRFSAAGLEQFKGKFKPEWQTNYLAYSGDVIDLAALALKLETALKVS